jgi:nucleoside-diphosphate-sugar epimerase
MRVVVTGGLGYIGSHTCIALALEGHRLCIVDNLANAKRSVLERIRELAPGADLEFVRADLRDAAALDRVFGAPAPDRIDAVVHFAGLKAVGESVAKPLEYYDNNVAGTVALLLSMARHGVEHLVFSSSATVYGEPERLPLTEDHRLDATNPYGRTKLMIEHIIADHAAARAAFRHATLRYFNPIGAHASGRIGEDPRGIPNNLFPYLTQVAVGRLPKLRIFGDRRRHRRARLHPRGRPRRRAPRRAALPARAGPLDHRQPRHRARQFGARSGGRVRARHRPQGPLRDRRAAARRFGVLLRRHRLRGPRTRLARAVRHRGHVPRRMALAIGQSRRISGLRGRALALLLLLLAAALPAAGAPPAVAFYYGAAPPLAELAAFDAVVLEPAQLPGAAPAGKDTLWFAYVSVGEVERSRPYFGALPAAWQIGRNPAFDSIVVDQAQPEWPAFFAERVVRPLWERGWRGFFLDTLDSYHLEAKTQEARARQEAGLAAVVRTLRARFPGVKLFFNRGFEILPAVHADAWGVAAESLYRAYDHGAKRYVEVKAADREWLSAQLARVRDEYKLPAVAIDYVAPAERELARATARRIAADGFIPWVSNPALDQLGVGAIEVMPRRVLMLYEKAPGDQLIYLDAHRVGAMPVEWLGYVPEYRDIAEPLPEGVLAGRYAGIVTWLTDDSPAGERLYPWLQRQIGDGLRVAVLGAFGFRIDGARAAALGLGLGQIPRPPAAVKVLARDAMLGYETAPLPDRRTFQPLTVARGGGRALLSLQGDEGERMDPVALTAWGGYALYPYHVITLPGAGSKRWVIDPFAFIGRALALPAMPVPDVTTGSGRRLLLVHVDGDGFPSRAERAGGPFAGRVLLDEVLARYRIPHTVSVIEGEIAARGLHAAQSPELESLARRIFALPQVEIASHSLSHPFRWQASTQAGGGDAYQYSLQLPGYRYDARAEVGGSVGYIDARLAPPGKRTRVFLWTGDCNPDELPLEEAARAGVLNMNGGDTLITRADPSLTLVSPLGIPRGRHFQVYAPNQNENVYTELWRGPYYGYERAIETFELTELPRRLKPVNIYYHAYSTTKAASLAALHKVYRWALAQPLHPVPASEYIQRVLDFPGVVIARSADGWRVRGLGAIRSLRAPAALGVPAGDVAGSTEHGGQSYALLAGDGAGVELRYGPADANARGPRLAEANARVLSFRRNAAGDGALLSLAGHVPIEFRLADAGGARCEARLEGRALPRGADGIYRIPRLQADGIELRCA